MKLKRDLIRITILFSVVVICATQDSFAQKGYIITDSVYQQGHIASQSAFKNNREVNFGKTKKDSHNTYYPEDLKEYGIEGGTTYLSKSIPEESSSASYFLSRLVNGKAKLYALKIKGGHRFFGETNNVLTEIRKDKSFRNTLSNILNNCDSFQTSISLAKRNVRSLTRVFTLHNSCYQGLFPTFRKGLFFGISYTHLTIRTITGNSISMGNDVSPFFGAFIEMPLGLKPGWFLNVQASYQENSFSVFKAGSVSKTDFLINTSALSVPFQVKYSSNSAKLRRFVYSGAALTYNVKTRSESFEAAGSGSVIEISRTKLNAISPYQLGGIIGAGLEYSVRPKNSLLLEMRFCKGAGIGDQNNHKVSSFQLIAAANF